MDPYFNILQTPWLLLTTAGVSLLAIKAIAISKNAEVSKSKLIIPLALAVLGIGIDYFVKTNYEKVDYAMDTLMRSATNCTPRNMEPIISPEYTDNAGQTKETLMLFCNAFFAEPNVKSVNKAYYDISIDGSKAVCGFKFIIIPNPKSIYSLYASVLSVEAVTFFEKNSNSQWLMTSSEIKTVNKNAISWKDALNY